MNKKTIVIVGLFLLLEGYSVSRALNLELTFALFAFLSFSIFLFNFFGIQQTGEGTTGRGYGLYFELVDRMRNPSASRRTVLDRVDPMNVAFVLIAVINLALAFVF